MEPRSSTRFWEEAEEEDSFEKVAITLRQHKFLISGQLIAALGRPGGYQEGLAQMGLS